MFVFGLEISKGGFEMSNPLETTPKKTFLPQAQRALAEAKKRRHVETKPKPNENAGPKGVEPTRYGDWERGGITYDF